MFRDNLVHLRKLNRMTQEDVAEKVGVTRQAIGAGSGQMQTPG